VFRHSDAPAGGDADAWVVDFETMMMFHDTKKTGARDAQCAYSVRRKEDGTWQQRLDVDAERSRLARAQKRATDEKAREAVAAEMRQLASAGKWTPVPGAWAGELERRYQAFLRASPERRASA
jgi:hypothetical protein